MREVACLHLLFDGVVVQVLRHLICTFRANVIKIFAGTQGERTLPLIQLMARWSSDVIARYVVDTPLGTIAQVCRRESAARDLQNTVAEARRSAACAQRELDQMKAMFLDAFLADVRMEASASIAPRVLPQGPSLPCVLRGGGGNIQIIANRAVNVLPAFEWRTRCGWKFGLSDHSFLQHKGQASER